MKNTNKITWIVSLIFISILTSCFDDKSELQKIEYPDILVDRTNESPFFTLAYGRDFTYEPRLIRMAGKDTIPLTSEECEEYTYLWKSTVIATDYDTTSRVLSHERILKTPIVFAPNSGEYNYRLQLQIEHKLTGVRKHFNWRFKVLGTYSSGLLVADTKNEQESDISLIMSQTYNSDLNSYDQDIIHRDIFKLVNNIPVQGLVSSMAYVNDAEAGQAPVVDLVVREKSLIRMDAITMQEVSRDGELFYYQPEIFKPQLVMPLYFGKWGFCLNNGAAHAYEFYYGSKFSYASGINDDYRFSEVCVPVTTSLCKVILFDQLSSKFIVFAGRDDVTFLEMSAGGVFDPTKMQGVEPIFGGEGDNKTGRCLVRKDQKLYIYEFAYVGGKYIGQEIYDMSNCTDLDKASCYAFSPGNAEFYYGVKDKLHVAILNRDVPSSRVVYEQFGENENLTHLLVHTGKGKTTWSEDGTGNPIWTDSKNNLISVATYNDKVGGRIYCLPIQYGGNGGIADQKYVRMHGGFGRILSLAVRL